MKGSPETVDYTTSGKPQTVPLSPYHRWWRNVWRNTTTPCDYWLRQIANWKITDYPTWEYPSDLMHLMTRHRYYTVTRGFFLHGKYVHMCHSHAVMWRKAQGKSILSLINLLPIFHCFRPPSLSACPHPFGIAGKWGESIQVWICSFILWISVRNSSQWPPDVLDWPFTKLPRCAEQPNSTSDTSID